MVGWKMPFFNRRVIYELVFLCVSRFDGWTVEFRLAKSIARDAPIHGQTPLQWKCAAIGK
jgi:hypothetical protein